MRLGVHKELGPCHSDVQSGRTPAIQWIFGMRVARIDSEEWKEIRHALPRVENRCRPATCNVVDVETRSGMYTRPPSPFSTQTSVRLARSTTEDPPRDRSEEPGRAFR